MNKLIKFFSISLFGYIFGVLFLATPYFAIALPAIFILSLNAVLAVAAWLVSEIYLGNFQVLGANPRTIIALTLGSIFMLREIISYRGENLKRTLIFLKIPLLLVILGIITNIISGAKFPEYSRWLITLISNLMMVLLMAFGIRNKQQFRQVIFIFLAIVIIDCGIGLLQYLGLKQAYDIREYLSKSQIYSPAGRILGLSRNIIEYSYLLLLGFFIFAGNVIGKKIDRKLIMEFGLIVVGMTLIINATRSAIGGIFLSLIIYSFFHRKIFREKTIPKQNIIFGLGVIFLIFIAYFVIKGNDSSSIFSKKWLTLQDTSAVGRLSRFQLAFNVSIDNPFGIGTANYEKYLYDYWSKLPSMRGISLEEFSAHNNFLRTTLEYGFLGGILLVIFLITLFKKSVVLFKKTNDVYIKNFMIAVFYYLVAYIFQIFFHNFGPFYGDNLFWFLIGLLACAANIIFKEERQENLDV